MYSSLDNIVRGFLLNKQYTLHWYVQCLKYASDCLRELSMDDLQVVNSTVLKLNAYFAAPLPDGYIDWIRVGIENGQYVKPLTQIDGMNRTYNYGSDGNPKPWPQLREGQSDLAYFGVPYLTFFSNSYNSRGENTGALYGFRSDGSPYIFQVMRERNEIQFDSTISFNKFVMDFISDGRTSSAATRVDPYAEKTIEDWMDWQLDENNRSVPAGEKERKFDKYVGSRTILRARKNDMGPAEILNSMRKNYTGTIKT